MNIFRRILVKSILLACVYVNHGQVCNSSFYTLISNDRRSTMAVYDSTIDLALCDAGIDEGRWFRFQSHAGNTIPERAANDTVPINRCGTQAPIYIRGLNSHPATDGATVNATVCANSGSNPCSWTDVIQIHRCPPDLAGNDGYSLYKLKSPPGCSLSYCAGEGQSCNRGDYWNGFQCVNYFPSMSGFPLFAGPHINGTGRGSEIYFTCTVQYTRQINDSNARFRVTFLFDGQPLEVIVTPFSTLSSIVLTADSNKTVTLGEYYLKGRVGKEITCQVGSFWDGYESTNSSTKISQGKYYVALESKLTTYTWNVTNGATLPLTFNSTVPFTCSHCLLSTDKSCCKYNFRLKSNAASQCALIWSNGTTATTSLYFLPQSSPNRTSYALNFWPYTDDYADSLETGLLSLWHNYTIPSAKVEVVPSNVPYKTCTSVTDPHVTSFDGRYFTNGQVGDFYLVKAINANQTMEIQVRHETCNGGASCNCGVIVREGNSAFKISICENGVWDLYRQRTPTVVRLLIQNPPDSSAVYRDGTGLKFSVRMPSGLRVEIDAQNPWFNIIVNLPPVYYGKTDTFSMCGNCNNNLNDDEYINFSIFRVPDENNYFKNQSECSPVFNPPVATCNCFNSTVISCSNSDSMMTLVTQANDFLPERWTTGVVCTKPGLVTMNQLQEQSNDNDFILGPEILFPHFSYDPEFGVNASYTWPTLKGKTLANVEQYCRDLLHNSSIYSDCSTTVDIEAIIQPCISDIQIIDDWLPAGPFVTIFQENCMSTKVSRINSSDTLYNTTLSQLVTLSNMICLNQCSGHGTCDDGNCTCDQGYIGADCGIDESLPPSLTGIMKSDTCDVRQRPCEVISVLGSGVVSSSALTCRFTETNTKSQSETRGIFIIAGEYSCPVPRTNVHRRRRSTTARTSAKSSMNVSITVDGSTYSNTIRFLLYDSLCLNCNSRSEVCTQTVNTCLISNECFADGSVNPDNANQKCIPTKSKDSWTTFSGERTTTANNMNNSAPSLNGIWQMFLTFVILKLYMYL